MSTNNTIALCVIAGDDALQDGIEKMLASVVGKVDYLSIIFNGTDANVRKEIQRAAQDIKLPGCLTQVPWGDDFSEQRNASFAEAERNFGPDWFFWLDCDDVIEESVDLRAAVAQIRKIGAHGAFMDYRYQSYAGTLIASHMKERLFRADVGFTWIYPIHENCMGPLGSRMTQLDREQFYVTHERGDINPKRKRNLRIVSRWYEEQGDVEPRAVLFMAHELFALAEETEDERTKRNYFGQALKLYRRFIDGTDPDDDSYTANRQSAEILRILGQFDKSIDIDLQGVKMQATHPSSYVGIATTFHAIEAWEDAIQWAQMARMVTKLPDGLHIVEPMDHQYKPLMIEGDALMKLGRYHDAMRVYEDACDILADDFTVDKRNAAMEAWHVSRNKPEAIDVRKDRFGSNSERSIAFFVPPSIEPWNPELLTRGLGGTETSIILLADELSKLGWRVVIFGSPGDWEGFVRDYESGGSTEWHQSYQYQADEHFRAFVALRTPEILEAPISADVKILWMHDVHAGQHDISAFAKADKIVTPSLWHWKHLNRVYGDLDRERGYVMFNGISPEMFDFTTGENPPVRDPSKMIYASSPDRGLPRLLELWPEIAARVEGASLDIYYGWDSIDKIIEQGLPTAPQLKYFKERLLYQLEELQLDGHMVNWRGRVGQDELAIAMQQSGVMPYPANFNETFGIVFAQAMTAGMIPVVPNLGALPDMVGDARFVVPGPPDAMEYGKRFVDAVVAASQALPEDREFFNHRVKNITWKSMAESWVSMIDAKRRKDETKLTVIEGGRA